MSTRKNYGSVRMTDALRARLARHHQDYRRLMRVDAKLGDLLARVIELGIDAHLHEIESLAQHREQMPTRALAPALTMPPPSRADASE